MPMRRRASKAVECIECKQQIKNVVPHYERHHPEIYQDWYSKLATNQKFVINVDEVTI